MVPGSTFRYGSNFCRVTLRPRLSSKQPMLAAAIPFPSEETTPPVTKMYLAILISHHTKQLRYFFPILGRIDAQRFILRFHYANFEPVFERAQLLQALGPLEGTDRQIGILEQEIAPIHIQPDMFETNRSLAVDPHMRDRGAREINRVARKIR